MKEGNINAIEHYYGRQEAMTRECLLALRSIIFSIDDNIVHKLKYQIPFFCYNDCNIGFLWVHRKKITIGFIEDKKLQPSIIGLQKKDKIFMIDINPLEDIPIDIIKNSLEGLIKNTQ